jgi:hypothetical protein
MDTQLLAAVAMSFILFSYFIERTLGDQMGDTEYVVRTLLDFTENQTFKHVDEACHTSTIILNSPEKEDQYYYSYIFIIFISYPRSILSSFCFIYFKRTKKSKIT